MATSIAVAVQSLPFLANEIKYGLIKESKNIVTHCLFWVKVWKLGAVLPNVCYYSKNSAAPNVCLSPLAVEFLCTWTLHYCLQTSVTAPAKYELF